MSASQEIEEHKPGEQWSDEVVRECARVFTMTGSYEKTSAITSVPRATLAAWEHRGNDVWVDSCTKLQHESDRELLNRYIEGAKASIDQTMAELPNATAQQAATISGIFLDKSRLIANRSTSIREDRSLRDLSESFDAMFKDYQERHTISHQDGKGNEIDGENDN